MLRPLTFSVSRPGSGGLTLLLLLVVLVPSVCLLWFLNQAVQNERLAVQQKLLDLYQGQLTEYAFRMNDGWQRQSQDFDVFFPNGKWPPAYSHSANFASMFAQFETNVAESAISFDSAGQVRYPRPSVAPPPEPDVPAWMEALRGESRTPDIESIIVF